MTDITSLDATAQAELVRTGEVGPTELVTAAIGRSERLNPDLNALIWDRFEEAAAEAAGDLPDGPFRGVPYVLKDLDGLAAGQPYHAGTRVLRDHRYVADRDTALTEAFRAAGLVCIGRTNAPELGLVPTTEPETYGPTRNPWDPTRSPGGSSGGSAAAVAAEIVPVAHAGDGGGSIRIPASACGLVGLKPSRGRVTLGPEAGEGWGGLVARLAVTRTVRDTATLLDLASTPGVGDPYWAPPPERPYLSEVGADPGALRIGWVSDPPDGSAVTDPEVAAATERTASLLESLGHEVAPASPAALADPSVAVSFITCFGAWVARDLDHIAEITGTPVTAAGVEAGTWAVAEMGREVSAAAYLGAVECLHAYTRDVVRWWAEDGYDLLLTPTMPELPPTLGQFHSSVEDPLAGLLRSTATVSLTAVFNITGQPAVSLPLEMSAGGLPVGIQLVGAPAREDVLIRVAAQLEQAAPWAGRRPPVAR